MLDHLHCRPLVLLQHLLDQVDAAARAIELIAQEHVGRTCCGTEPAMHAGAQDLVGLADVGVGELLEGEFCLHLAATRDNRPRLRMSDGSNDALTRAVSAAMPPSSGGKTSMVSRRASDARISIACPPIAPTRSR